MAGQVDILVVEDEAPIRTLWGRFLAKWGYHADMAENGQIALDKTHRKKYELVITDLTMPVMTGQELIHRVKNEKPDIEFIVTTGNGTIEIAVEMMKAGAFDFLTKPINFNHAELIIKKCLETVRARVENLELRQKNRDLKELNELKEKFIAITSHELRTPVSIINNIVEIIAPELEHLESGKMFSFISRSSRHLNEIVGQMHELSHSSSGELELSVESTLLAPLFNEVEEEFSWVQRKRGHQVRWDIPRDLTAVIDRVKFKKVIRELLQNAIKFTPDGGDITISANPEEGGGVRIVVSDTGIGIPKESIDKIFHLFYEVGDTMQHHTSKDDFLGGGMGIGLAIVDDIVKAHNGTMEVDSKSGAGSSFIIHLPGRYSSPG